MRKDLYLLLVFVFLGTVAYSQLTEVIPPDLLGTTNQKGKFEPWSNNDKTTSCGVDTLYYSRYNNTFISPRYLRLDPGWAAGMYFHIDDTVWLHGFNFYAYALTQAGGVTSQTVDCKVYYAATSKLPAGLALASTSKTIQYTGFSLDQLREKVLFTNPVMLVSDFVVTFEIPSTSSNDVVTASNDYLNNDGFGNSFSCVKLSSGWSNNLVIGTDPFDADFYFEPVVEYKMTAKFDHGPNSCLGNGKVFDFINTTSFALNPQFSKEVLDTTLDDNFIWNYGDGTPNDTIVHGSHFYSGTLGYNIELSAEFKNWRGATCKDDTLIFVDESNTIANFKSTVNGKIASFSNKSQNSKLWLWDFGDNTPISPLKNPTHQYTSNGTFYVKLLARNKGCVDSVIYPVTIADYTGVNEFNRENLKVEFGPNPVNEKMTVKTNLLADEKGKWTIFSIHGKLIKEGELKSNLEIDMSESQSGVYFIRFEIGAEVISKRFIKQ